jgi:glycosyltransferase involved in cell wall biosynthesis
MQIEVVDDCSTKDDPQEVVREIGDNRVAFFRKPQNEGAIANFNTCIRRSTGHMVHILHGDDYILPGFYTTLEQGLDRYREAALIACRAFVVDESGEIDSMTPRLRGLEDFSREPPPVFEGNPFRTPAVVIRRRFYEEYGGFLHHLIHTADWEMWHRAIALVGGVIINQPLAAYRSFAHNDTGRLEKTAENIRDYLRFFESVRSRYEALDEARFLQFTANVSYNQYMLFRRFGDFEAAACNEQMYQELKNKLKRQTPLLHRGRQFVRRTLQFGFR